MKSTKLIERYFNQKIKDVIEEQHWQGGMSLNKLCKMTKVCRQGLMYDLKKLGIRVMNRKEIEKHLDRSGPNSYWYGKKNPSASKRINTNNPAFDPEILKKATKSHAKRMKAKPTPTEALFAKNLVLLKVPFDFQVPIEKYILDFMIRGVCFEVMRVKSIPRDKKIKFIERSIYLEKLGIKTIKVDKRHCGDIEYVIKLLRDSNILDADNVVIKSQLVNAQPTSGS